MSYVYSPEPNQTLGVMRPMNPMEMTLDNPIVDSLVPSDYSTPVVDMSPYGPSHQIGGLGSVQDALNVLSLTDMIFG